MMAYPATVPNERALGTWTAPVRPYVELHIRPISERSLFGCFQELSSYSHGFIGKMVADRSWPEGVDLAGSSLSRMGGGSGTPATGQERSVPKGESSRSTFEISGRRGPQGQGDRQASKAPLADGPLDRGVWQHWTHTGTLRSGNAFDQQRTSKLCRSP
jgi:hypothetical protein